MANISFDNEQINLHKNNSYSVTNNPLGYQCLVLLSMLYVALMLCNAILTNRYLGGDNLYVLGGTLTSPFVFLLDNVIAELYGFKMTRSVIFFGIIAQSFFVVICLMVTHAPQPSFFTGNESYSQILGWPLLRIHLSGCIAYLFAMLLNSRILTQWKVLHKGEKFWLRCLGACTISEALYSFIAILLMELNSIPLGYILKVVVISYLIKMGYNLILSFPSQLLVNHIRNITGIDVYDFDVRFTPIAYQQIYRG